MARFDKLLERIRNLDGNLRFREVQRVLETYGYTMKSPGGGSSHATFRKPGKVPVTIPRHEPILKIYVLMVREAIEGEEIS